VETKINSSQSVSRATLSTNRILGATSLHGEFEELFNESVDVVALIV